MKTTFAAKVKNALNRYEGLQFITRKFNAWKYISKSNPEQFRIMLSPKYHTFCLEEHQRGEKGWTIIDSIDHCARPIIRDWFDKL